MDPSEYTTEQLEAMKRDVMRNVAKARRHIQSHEDWLTQLRSELDDIRDEMARRHKEDQQKLAEWNALAEKK